ncbi:MAG: hypothetical protein MUP81_06100 [Dehalococcoidia bacterium]|nr:hypothetical protein [Dehalococcoidia bacterium]
MACKECNEPLAKVTFSGGESYICLNWRCCLYRERQEVTRKVAPQRFSKPPGDYGTWGRYLRHLADTSRNYHALRGRGFPVKFCKRFQSNKQTKRIATLARRGLSVEYITKMLGDGHG